MFVSTRIAANAMLLAASVGTSAAMAQPAAPPKADAPNPSASGAAGAAPAASVPPSSMAYRSAFDGYKGLTEQPVQSWREANDTVGRIGGWQAYAREGQGGPVAGSAPPPAAKGMGNMPGMPADHGGMKTPSSGSGSAPSMARAASTPGPGKGPVGATSPKAQAPAASASMPADPMGNRKP